MTNARNPFKGRRIVLASEDRLRVQILAEALREQEAKATALRLPLRDRGILSDAELLIVDLQSGPAVQAAVKDLQADKRTHGVVVRTLDFRSIVGEDGCARLSLLEEMVAPIAADRALTERPKRPPPPPPGRLSSPNDPFAEVPTKAAAYRLTPSLSDVEVLSGSDPDTDPPAPPSPVAEPVAAIAPTRAQTVAAEAVPPAPKPSAPAAAVAPEPVHSEPVEAAVELEPSGLLMEPSGLLMEPSGPKALDHVEPPAAKREVEAETSDEREEGEEFVEPVSPTEMHADEFRKRRRFGSIAGISGAVALVAALGMVYFAGGRPEAVPPARAANRPSAAAAPMAAAPAAARTPLAQNPTDVPSTPPSAQGSADDVPAAQPSPEPAAQPSPEPAAAQPSPEPAARPDAEERQVAAALPAEQKTTDGNPAEAGRTPEDLIRDGTKLLGRDAEEAKRSFEAAVALAPKNPHAQAGLGQALLALDRLDDAQKALEAAIKLRPKRALYRVLLGDVLLKAGKPDEARAAWTKALELDPSDADAKKRLGM